MTEDQIRQAFETSKRSRGGFEWHGLDFSNPSDGQAWIKEEEVEAFKAYHQEFRKVHADDNLGVDFTDAEEERAEVEVVDNPDDM